MHACTLYATETAHDDLLQKGLAAYQAKNYAEAHDDFQKLLDQSGEHASVGLLHNLALTDLQLDQKAWALALWRKALSLQPSFRPARVGRDMLESKNQMRPFERDSFALWMHRTLESLSLFEILWLNALLIAGAGWLLIRYAARRKLALETEGPLPPFPTVAIMLGGLLLASFVLIAFKTRDLLSPRATVVAAKTSVHSLPSDDSVSLYDLSGGSEVVVRRKHDDWVQVESAEGGGGWVKSHDLFETSALR